MKKAKQRSAKNPAFPIKWMINADTTIFRADLMDFRKTVIIIRQTQYDDWTWEMSRTYKNSLVVDEGLRYESPHQAKDAALKFYDETSATSFKSNPLHDEDLAACYYGLLRLRSNPDASEDIDEEILDALESEGLWNIDSGVTKEGTDWLESVSSDSHDD